MLKGGIFSSAARFRLVEGFPAKPPEHLLVLMTCDSDPLSAYARARDSAGPVPPLARHAGLFRLYSSYPA
jgi:hypothetical protein